MKKDLAIGFIFLFLVIIVQPITSINITQIKEIKSDDKINNSYSEEDCSCQEIKTQDIERANRLLDGIKINFKIIRLKYGYIPDVKLNCNEILNKLDTLSNNGLICDILYAIYSQLVQIQDYFYDKGEELIGLTILYFGILPVYFKAIFHECDWLIDTPRR